MKRYIKEIIIALLQLAMFFFAPLLAGPTEVIAMVLLMVFATFWFGFITGVISKVKLKFLYPFYAAVIFLPTIPIYYNSSALVHSLWYFVVSGVGLLLGTVIRLVICKVVNK